MHRIISVFIGFLLCINVASQDQDTSRLNIGQRTTRKISLEQKHVYLINVGDKQFVYGEINQKNVNVNVVMVDPEGNQIGRSDIVMGHKGFYLEIHNGGQYLIEVIPLRFLNTATRSGEYTIEIKRIESLGSSPEKLIDQIIDALYSDEGPGGSVTVVRDGRIIYSRAYGVANISNMIPYTTETLTNIGSVSKQFTGFAIVLLEKEGKLSLEDDIRKYIPECPDFGQKVTLKNLLNHTSGYREINLTYGMRGGKAGGSTTRNHLIKQIQKQSELQNAPGTKHSYCNTGYILMAEVVERVSGMAFDKWMEANVFNPLGMKHTVVSMPILGQIQKIVPNSAQGIMDYYGEYGTSLDEPAFYGASSIYSTASDMSKWLMNFHGTGVGGSESIFRLTEPGILTSGDTIDYSLGLYISEHNGIHRYSHDGFDAFNSSEMAYYPELNAGTIIINNSRIFPEFSKRLSELFISEYYSEPLKVGEQPEDYEKQDGEIDPALLNAYTGRYESEEDDRMIVTFMREGNMLAANVISSKLLPSYFLLKAISDSSFVKESLDITITFQLDKNNKVKQANFKYAGDFTLHPLPPYKPSEKDLLAFKGLFYSSELESVYNINVQNSRLIVKDPGGIEMQLIPKYSDVFSHGYMGEYIFKRSEDKNVSGFVVQNVHFEKLK